MIHRKPFMTTAVIASVVLTACSDTTAPRTDKLVAHSTAAPHIEVTFTKWITTFPAMEGVTGGDVPGTFAGQLLSPKPSANGKILRLRARYEVKDPNGSHSFKALIKGKQNNNTGQAVLNGVIKEGWQIGARVHVTFQVITPCPQFARNVCFQGTIRIKPGDEHDEGDDD